MAAVCCLITRSTGHCPPFLGYRIGQSCPIRPRRASERGTVPFCSLGTAKSGQSPPILLDALSLVRQKILNDNRLFHLLARRFINANPHANAARRGWVWGQRVELAEIINYAKTNFTTYVIV